MLIIQTSFLVKGTIAMTIWPFIFVADKKRFNADVTNMRHELIHGQQQKEMLLVFFYLWYFIEYLVRWSYLDSDKAYRRISFEKEAYQMEHNPEYLTKNERHRFAWWGYL